MDEIQKAIGKAGTMSNMKERAHFCYDEMVPAMNRLREPADRLEMIVDKEYWPFPSYGDMIFEVSILRHKAQDRLFRRRRSAGAAGFLPWAGEISFGRPLRKMAGNGILYLVFSLKTRKTGKENAAQAAAE